MVKSIINRNNLREADYFDDVFSTDSNAKNYSQILFRPGRPPQTRELTQLQTLLMERDKSFLDTYFKNGSVIEGLNLNIKSNGVNWILYTDLGLIYYDGTVFKVEPLEYVVLGTQFPVSKNEKIGFELGIKVNFSIVDASDDIELKDPSVKYYENEGLVGADRLLVTFSLVNKETILQDIETSNNRIHQYFDFAWVEIVQVMPDNPPIGLIEINEIKYRNRKCRIQDIFEDFPSYNNEILDGLSINLNNLTDIKLSNREFKSKDSLGSLGSLNLNQSLDLFHLYFNLASLSDSPEFSIHIPWAIKPIVPVQYPGAYFLPQFGAFSVIKNLPEYASWTSTDAFRLGGLNLNVFNPNRAIVDDDRNYVIVKKGVGKVRDKIIPMTENKILKLEKPVYEFRGETSPEFSTFYDKLAYYKNSENAESGIYFKMFYENKDFSLKGVPLEERYSKMIDIHNVYPFILPGRKILIQKYNDSNSSWMDIAKANICSLTSEPVKEEKNDWIQGKSKCYVNFANDEGFKVIFDEMPEEFVQGNMRDFNCMIKIANQIRKVVSIDGKVILRFPTIDLLPVNIFNAFEKGNSITLTKKDISGATNSVIMNIAEKQYEPDPSNPANSTAKLVLTPSLGGFTQVKKALSAMNVNSGSKIMTGGDHVIGIESPVLDFSKFSLTDPIKLSNLIFDFKFEYHVTVETAFINSDENMGTELHPTNFNYSYTNELFSKVFFHNIEFLNQKTYKDLEPEIYFDDASHSIPTRIVVYNDFNQSFNSNMFIEKGIKIRRTADTKYDLETNSMYHEYAKIPNPFVRKILNKTITTIVEYTSRVAYKPLAGIPNWGAIEFNSTESGDKVKGVVSLYGTKVKPRTDSEILGGPNGTTEFDYHFSKHDDSQPTITVRSFKLENSDGEISKSMIIAGPRRKRVSDDELDPTLNMLTTKIVKDGSNNFWLEVPEDENWLGSSTDPLNSTCLFPGDYITVWFDGKPYYMMINGPNTNESISDQQGEGSDIRKATNIDAVFGVHISSPVLSENYGETITNFTREILQKIVDADIRLDYDICSIAWFNPSDIPEIEWEKQDLRRTTYFERVAFDTYSPKETYLINKNYLPSSVFNFKGNDFDIDTVLQSFHIILSDSTLASDSILTSNWAFKTKEAFFIEHNYSILNNTIENYSINTGMALEYAGEYVKRAQFPIVSTGIGGVISELSISPSPSETNIISLYDYSVTDKPIPIQRAVGIQFFHWVPKLEMPLQCIDAVNHESGEGYKYGREYFLHVYTESNEETLNLVDWTERQFVKQQLFDYSDGGLFWKKYEHNINSQTKKIYDTDSIIRLETADPIKLTVYKEIDSINADIPGYVSGLNPSNSFANAMVENERFIRKDLNTKFHKPYIIAKERFEQVSRIAQNSSGTHITETEGKVIDYTHKAIVYKDAYPLENQSKEIRGFQSFQYDVILPEIVNIYMNEFGRIETLIGQSTFLKNFAPIFNNEKLYLGTVINPPIYKDYTVDDDSRNLNFITVPKYFKNFNENVYEKIENFQLNKKIDLNKKSLDLMKIHEYNRRDDYITSNNNETVGDFQYVEKGTLESTGFDGYIIEGLIIEDKNLINFSNFNLDLTNMEASFDLKAVLGSNFIDFPYECDYPISSWYKNNNVKYSTLPFSKNSDWNNYIADYEFRDGMLVNIWDNTQNIKISGTLVDIDNKIHMFFASEDNYNLLVDDFITQKIDGSYVSTAKVLSVESTLVDGVYYVTEVIARVIVDDIYDILNNDIKVSGHAFIHYDHPTIPNIRFQTWTIGFTHTQNIPLKVFPEGNPIKEINSVILDSDLRIEFMPQVESVVGSHIIKNRNLTLHDSEIFKEIKVGETIKILDKLSGIHWSSNISAILDEEHILLNSDLPFVIFPFQRESFYVMKPLITEHEHYKRSQTFMNPKIYNIYNSLITNEYIQEDEFSLKDENQELSSMKWSYDPSIIQNKVPTMNLHNNEFLPKAETKETKRLEWLKNDNVSSSLDNVFFSLKPSRLFKIVETLNYKTDSLNFNYPILGNRESFIINNVNINFKENSINKKDINTVLLYDVMELDESDNHKIFLKDNNFIEEDYFSIQSVDDSRKDEDFNYIFTNKIYPIQTNLKRFNYNRLFLTPRLCPINKKMGSVENNTNINSFAQIEPLELTNQNFYSSDSTQGFTALCIDNFNFAPKQSGYNHYISDMTTLNKYTDTCLYLIDGIYKVGFMNGRNCSIGNDNSYISANNEEPWQIDRCLTKVKHASSFSSFNDEYDYIFKQINKPLILQTYDIPYVQEELGTLVPESSKSDATKHYELLKNKTNSLNQHEFLDTLKDEYWKTYLPNVYQTYQFDEPYMLRSLDVFIKSKFVRQAHFEGRVAIYFGFLINGQLSENGIIHTEVIRFKNNDIVSNIMIQQGKIHIDLDTPINIPKNAQFFIGFLKERSLITNADIELFYIDNGSYDASVTQTQISYPANFNSKLFVNNTTYNSRILKIDLSVDSYSEQVYDYVNVYSPSWVYNDNPNISNFVAPFDRIVIVGEDYQVAGTSIQYFYSIDGKDKIDATKVWFECYLNDEIVFDETQNNIVFKSVIRTTGENISPIIKGTATLHFKSYKRDKLEKIKWLGKDVEITNCTAQLKINNLKFKMNYSDIVLEDNVIQKDMSAFSQVYRMVIDFNVPELNTFDFKLSEFNGIPIIFRDGDTGEIINKFTTWTETEFLVNFPIVIGSEVSNSGLFKLPKFSVKPMLRKIKVPTFLGEEVVCNSDGSLWFSDSMKYGQNEKTQINLFGQVFYIQRINKETYRQVYEFCGIDFEKHKNIIVEIKMPVIESVGGFKVKTVKIKNVSFSSDMFVDNQEKIVFNLIYKPILSRLNVFKFINPTLFSFSPIKNTIGRIGGLNFGKQSTVTSQMASSLGKFSSVSNQLVNVTFKG